MVQLLGLAMPGSLRGKKKEQLPKPGETVGEDGLTHAAIFAGRSEGNEHPCLSLWYPDPMLMPTVVGPH